MYKLELTNLVNSRGWDLYRKYLEGQVASRQAGYFLPVTNGIDGVLAQEFAKGEGSGIYTVMHLLPFLLAAIEEETEDRKKQEDEEEA